MGDLLTSFMTDKGLTASSKLVYIYLYLEFGIDNISKVKNKEIAKATGLSERTITRALGLLISKFYLIAESIILVHDIRGIETMRELEMKTPIGIKEN